MDKVTNQYNRDMKKVLIPFEIYIIEVSRKRTDDGEFISASKVRQFLEKKNITELNKMLSPTTLDYLKNLIKSDRNI